MGIPAYFSYIVRNHPEILRKFRSSEWLIDNLYIDANSTIYDVIHENFERLAALSGGSSEYGCDTVYNEIIRLVITKLEGIIATIGPRAVVIIAFDGVAPVAKMNQQCQRRHKGSIERGLRGISGLNTSFITPGTVFMDLLNVAIYAHSWHSVAKVVVSGSDQVGEGEHKLFAAIRDNSEYHRTSRTVVYGLDADLIILSLNHLSICMGGIYLYRETPVFIQSINHGNRGVVSKPTEGKATELNKGLSAEEQYIMDIPRFAKEISLIMSGGPVSDYVFMSFFLGNDFMPHFPALNLRGAGIDHLMTCYTKLISSVNEDKRNTGLFISSSDSSDSKACVEVSWRSVRAFIALMSVDEADWIASEGDRRDKQASGLMRSGEGVNDLDNVPLLNRAVEKYIAGGEYPNWESRYYNALCGVSCEDYATTRGQDAIKGLCVNYLEGLEWCMKYYTVGCCNWQWSYVATYPPLLVDLAKYVPVYNEPFFGDAAAGVSVSPVEQLEYVLPNVAKKALIRGWKGDASAVIVPVKLSELDKVYEWTYCRYLWEAHLSSA